MIYEYKVAKIFIYRGLKISQKGVLICEAKRIGSLIVGIFTSMAGPYDETVITL
jgi:hypothetical protein